MHVKGLTTMFLRKSLNRRRLRQSLLYGSYQLDRHPRLCCLAPLTCKQGSVMLVDCFCCHKTKDESIMQTEEEQQENEKKAKEKRQTLFAQYELKQIVGDIERSKLPRQSVSFLEIAEKNPFFYGTKGEKRREQLAKKFSWYKLLPIKNYLVHLQSLQVSEVSETTRAEIDAFKQCEGDVDPSIPEATKIVESSSSASSESAASQSFRFQRRSL